MHPSAGEDPVGATTTEPFAPEALYELKVDTDGDAVADIAYRVRFSAFERSAQTAIVRRIDGLQANGTGDGGRVIVDGAPVSIGHEAKITEAGEIRFFAGWRSDPFFCDVQGAKNNFQFTGDDFFADKDVCSIVLEMPNSALGTREVRLWARTLVPDDGGGCIQVERGARPAQAVILVEEKDAYLVGEPAHDARFVPAFAHALEHTGGYKLLRIGAGSWDIKIRYTAKTHTSGGRRGGVSRSDDGRLDVKFSGQASDAGLGLGWRRYIRP